MRSRYDIHRMDVKCRHCGYVFSCGRMHLAWLAGSCVVGGCPRCRKHLDAARDVLAPTSPSDLERRAAAANADTAAQL